jgi:ribosomal protein L11 methyltransferase
VLAELLELAPSGVEEAALGDDVVEYAVYGPPGELPGLPDLRAAAGGALVEITTSEVAGDWSERWREFHRPLVLDGALTVRPPWEPPGSTPIDLVIDPGQAFGTGAHATTRLCLELMLSSGSRSGSFVDVGCGSGVLAIAAAALGYSPVTALDNDPAAVSATRDNARINGVELEVRRLDLRTEQVPSGSFMAANLLGAQLLALTASVADPVPDHLIASGVLVDEADRIADAFARRGLREAERRVSGEWAALLLSA